MQPELAVPFAGPPCFLDPELRHFNTSLRPPGIFPDSEQAVEWLREHLPGQAWACFRPGDRIDLATGAVTPDPVSARFSYTDGIDGYLDRYAADRAGALARVHAAAGAPGPDLGDRFRRHFTRLGTLSPYFLTRIGMTVRFEVTGPHGGTWDVRMDADGLRVDLDGGAAAPEYTFTLAGHRLGAVLHGQIAWEDLLLSLRLTARRDPDRYNDYLIGLLKHANPRHWPRSRRTRPGGTPTSGSWCGRGSAPTRSAGTARTPARTSRSVRSSRAGRCAASATTSSSTWRRGSAATAGTAPAPDCSAGPRAPGPVTAARTRARAARLTTMSRQRRAVLGATPVEVSRPARCHAGWAPLQGHRDHPVPAATNRSENAWATTATSACSPFSNEEGDRWVKRLAPCWRRSSSAAHSAL